MGRLAWFPKFILGPLAAAALGYWLIGPRLAGDPKIQKLVQEKVPGILHPKPEAPETTETSTLAAPQVTVDVKPVAVEPMSSSPDEEKPKPKPRRKRRRSHRTVSATESNPEEPPHSDRSGPDPASTPDG